MRRGRQQSTAQPQCCSDTGRACINHLLLGCSTSPKPWLSPKSWVFQPKPGVFHPSVHHPAAGRPSRRQTRFPALAKPGLWPQKSDRPDLAIYLCASFLLLFMAKKCVPPPPSPGTARVALIPAPPLTQTERRARVPRQQMEQRGACPFPPVPISPGFCSRGAVWPPTAFLTSLEGAACRASRASGLLLMLPLSWERSLGADGSRGEGGSGFCRGKQILPLCPDE